MNSYFQDIIYARWFQQELTFRLVTLNEFPLDYEADTTLVRLSNAEMFMQPGKIKKYITCVFTYPHPDRNQPPFKIALEEDMLYDLMHIPSMRFI